MHKFEILSQKIIYTNGIRPENVPAIRDCKTVVVFSNTVPAADHTVLFEGTDFRNKEMHIPVEKRKGVIVYGGCRFQYASTKPGS